MNMGQDDKFVKYMLCNLADYNTLEMTRMIVWHGSKIFIWCIGISIYDFYCCFVQISSMGHFGMKSLK